MSQTQSKKLLREVEARINPCQLTELYLTHVLSNKGFSNRNIVTFYECLEGICRKCFDNILPCDCEKRK